MLKQRHFVYKIIIGIIATLAFLALTYFLKYNRQSHLTDPPSFILKLKEYCLSLPKSKDSAIKLVDIMGQNELTFLDCKEKISTLILIDDSNQKKLNACNENNTRIDIKFEENKVKLNSCEEKFINLKQCKENTAKLENKITDLQKQLAEKMHTKPISARLNAAEEPRVLREILSSETSKSEVPGIFPSTIHYVWCENKSFKFEHALGIISTVRILNPLRLVFYYNYLPNSGGYYYYSWFYELTQSLPNFDLKKIDRVIRCNTMDAVEFALEQIASSGGGGFYFGERAVLTYIPEDWKTKEFVTYSKPGSLSSEGLIVLIKQVSANKKEDIKQLKQKVLKDPYYCHTAQEFDSRDPDTTQSSPCVVLPSDVLPEHILNNTSQLNAVLRWLYYGRREGLQAEQSSPVVWSFESYVCVISALYVGGFERVYVHGDTRPSGYWWEKLKQENVTFVYVDQPHNVFQQELNVMAHRADILRVLILFKYGGTYNDKDVIWVKPLSESQRRYPTIMCYEWPEVPPWPRAVNNGLLVSKAGAPFLLKILDSFWFYRDDMWAMNSVLMYYKLYERNPEMVHIDPKLQVKYKRWSSVTITSVILHAFHFIHMNAPPIFTSFSAIKNKTSVDALLLRRLMDAIQKAGRAHLLEEKN
ncbi:uncharacterized protein LOC131940258 [Physella acuta]|uniref:uncharacterized protein LOC131940258 n=1 Tax=Physella acuta TaxID=109671 RepID=UPI0027DE3D23|nr:uncharacterized protein LOC131940258 [Physella acuta]